MPIEKAEAAAAVALAAEQIEGAVAVPVHKRTQVRADVLHRFSSKQNRHGRVEDWSRVGTFVAADVIAVIVRQKQILPAILVPVARQRTRARADVNRFSAGRQRLSGRQRRTPFGSVIQEQRHGSGTVRDNQILSAVVVPIADVETRVAARTGDAQRTAGRLQSSPGIELGKKSAADVAEPPDETVGVAREQVHSS